MDAAEHLFSQKGYEATRIETIAEKASVAPATVYNYFATKPNLLMELALRHVHAALPERRSFIRNLPDDPVEGILSFERLLAEQAMRHLSRECWRVIMSAQYLEPDGRASRTGARLNTLIKRHYIRLIRTYQQRGRLDATVDPIVLSELIVGITTFQFGNFVARTDGTVEEMLGQGARNIRFILSQILREPAGAGAA
ncbi:TetR/AcrR family transcriptional regulator; helix-turn-helix transcriptional regulator [Ancylobacter sp. Lp-2]|uniref:TetR/AcrR family transcriptional regulator n=1 Tax=Ancylobacter sp. Lp-2 TaxID=2881339 RepID=UPI001E5A0846|nr:TetR/AcrR family transcriptional regulator [Ancylobacter sp. Lp-2]MCB4770000.1 TetR/AcrR family transcriptional regulator; helix-turn-helix transcriptional regulator [Ancylobacter sp. Lp-2]